MENIYYDGTKLLSLPDLSGNKPELYILTGNRSSGKTTFFNRLAVKRFIKKRQKTAFLYRFNYELEECANKIFKDIQGLFFPNYTMAQKNICSDKAVELFLNDEACGYGIALNNADDIKKYSHLLSDTDYIVFDEFQSESNHYCNNEIAKFINIHKSIARGQGKMSRYVPVYMISNCVSLINPYFVEMGISDRIKSDTKFLRGNGYVLELNFNENAANASKLSGFEQAFSSNQYVAYSSQNVYLNDNLSFIENIKHPMKYVCTLSYMGNYFSIKECEKLGILYCDTKIDHTFPYRIAVTTDDHKINYVILAKNQVFIKSMRKFFENGCFRFKNQLAKQALLKLISY